MITENPQKIPFNFHCESCDYRCNSKKDYSKHLLTLKHKKIINGNENSQKIPATFMCSCGKEYKFLSGLSRHKNKCNDSTEKKEPTIEKKTQDDLLLVLIKENQEFKKMILEQNNIVMEQNKKNNELILELAQKPTTTITNNNKNKFNINFFLNEKCKDAMNITDFVDSLKLTLQDLEKTGEVGYVKGLTNIIVNGLNQLDVYKRPIHCSDVKRETLYIKDNDSWEKENEDKKKIKRAIKHISIRNAKQIGEWTKENKGYNDSSNKKSDKYLKLISEANGGEDDEINKIISNVSSHTAIDKQLE